MRQKWINAVKRKDWEPTTASKICSFHFREVDIDRTSLSCVRIREGAVPAIFPGFSQIKDRPPSKRHLQPSSSHDSSQTLESPTKKMRCDLTKSKSCLKTLKKKRKNLQTAKRRLVKRVANLNDIVKTLKQKLNFRDEECGLLTSISKDSDCLIRRSTEQTLNPKMRKLYSDRLKAFAITLHFLSPKAYVFIRKTFNAALPHPRTLRRWYSSINAEPGFSEEVFRALKEHNTNAAHKPICALMLNCMAIRKRLEWDGKRFHGTVNAGNTNTDDDSAPLASEALVFHLVSINSSWKCL